MYLQVNKLTIYRQYRLVLETNRYIYHVYRSLTIRYFTCFYKFTNLQNIDNISLDSRDYQIHIAVSNYQIYRMYLQVNPLSTLSTGSRDYQIYIVANYRIYRLKLQVYKLNKISFNIAWF